MNRFRTAAIIAAALLLVAWPPARAEVLTQGRHVRLCQPVVGYRRSRSAERRCLARATLVDQNGQPITTSNRLPVDVSTSVSITSLNQGGAGDPSTAWYIRPGTGANLATETGNLQNLALGMGTPSTGPYSGAAIATQISALKGVYGRNLRRRRCRRAVGCGMVRFGSASQVALGKRLASLLANTATDVGLTPVSSTATEASHVLKARAGQLFGLQVRFRDLRMRQARAG
jgi:hypothetical protein